MFEKNVDVVRYNGEVNPMYRLFPEKPATVEIVKVLDSHADDFRQDGLYTTAKGSLVRQAGFLVIWLVLTGAVIFGYSISQPLVLIGWGVVTIGAFWLFRKQDLAVSPGGVLNHSLEIKEGEMKRDHQLRREAMKRGLF